MTDPATPSPDTDLREVLAALDRIRSRAHQAEIYACGSRPQLNAADVFAEIDDYARTVADKLRARFSASPVSDQSQRSAVAAEIARPTPAPTEPVQPNRDGDALEAQVDAIWKDPSLTYSQCEFRERKLRKQAALSPPNPQAAVSTEPTTPSSAAEGEKLCDCKIGRCREAEEADAGGGLNSASLDAHDQNLISEGWERLKNADISARKRANDIRAEFDAFRATAAEDLQSWQRMYREMSASHELLLARAEAAEAALAESQRETLAQRHRAQDEEAHAMAAEARVQALEAEKASLRKGLEELRELSAKATPGEWRYGDRCLGGGFRNLENKTFARGCVNLVRSLLASTGEK
jgi:hypothetical protein